MVIITKDTPIEKNTRLNRYDYKINSGRTLSVSEKRHQEIQDILKEHGKLELIV